MTDMIQKVEDNHKITEELLETIFETVDIKKKKKKNILKDLNKYVERIIEMHRFERISAEDIDEVEYLNKKIADEVSKISDDQDKLASLRKMLEELRYQAY